MMSAPNWCWMRIDASGVKRCFVPSMWEEKTTPSSSTTAFEARTACADSRGSSGSAAPENSWERTFLKPAPRESTWNPPESVYVGPRQFMKRAKPPASSTTSEPGRRYRW